MTKVLAISGSLRQGSFTSSILASVGTRLPDGVEYELLDSAALKALEPYDQDDDGDTPPAGAAALRAKLHEADVLLIGTPEYNGTMPGQLKHLIDWGSRPRGETAALYAKPIAVISVSPSDYGAQWAGEATRKSLEVAGAHVLTEDPIAIGGVIAKLGEAGALSDEELGTRLTDLVRQLASHHKAVAD